ncbi:replication protein [Mixta calida]|nr:replication protein [Mixta calida]
MANLAYQNVSPIRPDMQAVERRVVNTDNGYTRIANELLEAVIGSGLTQNQLLITLAVIRKTYGYNKTSDWVGNTQLSELTGLPVTRCSTERNKLVKMKVLTVSGRMVGVNKEISSWQTKINGISKPAITETVNITESVKFTESVKETFTESVNHGLQDLLNTKDNSTKDKKDNNNTTPVVPKAVKPAKESKRSTQFPDDFAPNDSNIELAKKLGVNLEHEFDAFADYHQSKGSAFKDWNKALNTWIRNATRFGHKPAQQVKPAQSRTVAENFNSKNYGTTDLPSWMEG